MLKRCKENGVTVNHALEAISALAWSRVVEARSENREPMLYTAINLRPHLLPFPPSLPPPCHVLSPSDQTYWFLALTYFTLVLPAFPAASARAFWLRARSAKAQTHRMVHSRLLVPRALEMADLRAARARGTPRPDLTLADLSPADSSSPSTPTPPLLPGPAPSTALLGLSLIGNLDATYDRRAYPAFTLRDVTTASRQKAGGVLLLVHTFGGKLWVQMFYDECGFGEEMERFWEEVGRGVERYLVN
ncbi:hypothetical protein FPV67DRAFT_1563667 [Lyophyllum atratum]|nr:hypothetical protein FPV67DRAFT_1563667 [Lyophyllum atratum]